MNNTYLRGEVYRANLNPIVGSEQGGERPVLILQNDVGNRYSTTVIIAAITSRTDDKSKLPTHYYLTDDLPLEPPSVVLLEQIRTVDKKRLGEYICKLTDEQMHGVEYALKISFGLCKPRKTHISLSDKQADEPEMVLCLCNTCANDFFGTGAFLLRRANPKQTHKEKCDYCNMRMGWDLIVRRKQALRGETL